MKRLLCKFNGHTLKGGNTYALVGGSWDDDPSHNYRWVCGRCGHTANCRYGDRPAGFGPRFYFKVKIRLRLRLPAKATD